MITIHNNPYDMRTYTHRGISVVYNDMFWMDSDVEIEDTDECMTYCRCGGDLSPRYIYIIDMLKEKNLLPDDFIIMCCVCWNYKKTHGVKKK